MEFNEKLQKLRKQKGLTQEELANALFVSRAAVSKWESGRGYPNIDSLKAMAKFFSVTVDDLLSGSEGLAVAEEDHRQNSRHFCSLVFGVLDLSTAMFLFLPFFGEKAEGGVREVSLLSLRAIAPYMKTAYFAVVIAMIASGILNLALQNCSNAFWNRNKNKLSLMLHALGILLFILSPQPYAAAFLFVFMAVKLLMLTKKR